MQTKKFGELREAVKKRRGLNLSEPERSVDGNYFLTIMAGAVTVSIGPKGGFNIPAVRKYANGSDEYPSVFDAVVYADKCWERQETLQFDLAVGKGHDKPIVGADWKCRSAGCPCSSEKLVDRLYRSLDRTRDQVEVLVNNSP